jgi:hypothetical protein
MQPISSPPRAPAARTTSAANATGTCSTLGDQGKDAAVGECRSGGELAGDLVDDDVLRVDAGLGEGVELRVGVCSRVDTRA